MLHPHSRTLVLTDNYGNEILRTQTAADGRFQLRARWSAAQPATLQLGDEVARMWISPGDNLTITLDARRFDETLRYTGRGSRVNNYRAAEVLDQNRQQQQYRQTLAGPEAAFRIWLAATKRHDAARLAAAFPHPGPLEKPFVDYQRGELYFLRHQGWERRWPGDRLTRPGMVAPVFQAKNQTGKHLDLAALRGKVVYVDFWASWCGFCLVEAPAARALHAALADYASEVAFLNVSLDDDWDTWQCALEKNGIEGLNVVSPDSGRATAGVAYRLPSLPRYVLIGPDGRILDGNAPRPSSGQVEGLIRRALASANSPGKTGKP
ncbi:TlpA family protein disulfide reductase [Hymenobacter cheonanensis]|uniref:TlpA family protein disulfide reductase n=1 Tax=Hymenobacter sp. CA2-7 TaxID=3063993 RepID=UPI002712566F|nr:TlpA disulfide reductase family protein [Hymenobacter sp. CA2-7]MDO7886643.1 TlpA disulfide reductase family protein [Hymenobacter sp. CA2-7]